MFNQNKFHPTANLNEYFKIGTLAASIMLANGVLANDTSRTTTDSGDIETVTVYGEPGETDTATKLDLTIFETPQTVTAISRVQMDDFSLNKINQVLNYTPGVTVEDVELDRTYYTARGFNIVNFQYDGVSGLPFISGLASGQPDTALYKRVDVVKGASGLLTGVANPSATINYVRKRPTDDLQASTALSANEWGGYRLDGDVSGSLTDNIRGRVVVATGDTESYLDRHERQTSLFYGVIEADLSSTTMLTLGHSIDDAKSDGTLWGSLPLYYTDGSATNYDVSTSSAPEWTFANIKETQTFVELKQQLGDQWTLNAIYTLTDVEGESELFYLDGIPNPDETGLSAPYVFSDDSKDKTDVVDLFLSGRFNLLGREHQLVAGYNRLDSKSDAAGYLDLDEAGAIPLGSDWDKGNTLRPNDFEYLWGTIDVKRTLKSYYLSSRINFTDNLNVMMGVRKMDYDQSGISYGADQRLEADETVPYLGTTYQLTESLMAYGSYSEAFTPQSFAAEDFSPIGPTESSNSEIGLKKSLNDGGAVLTFALFKAEIDNVAEYVDRIMGVAVYEGRTYENEGFEVEIAGELAKGFNVSAGFTQVDIEDPNGDNNRPFIPERLLKLSGSYRVPALPDMKVSGVVKWQDDIATASGLAKQDSYALLDLAVHYDISNDVSVSLLVENATNEKYLSSLYNDQSYYGAPRNISASVSWKY